MTTTAHHTPLYAVSWGWNSGGRAGSVTAEDIDIPKQLQRSHLKSEAFIGGAAGKHHTLLVSDAGKVYALGEGRRGQLGFGNQFTGAPTKGGFYQSIPKEVTPSGRFKNKADLKISQVACGGKFSLARELSADEGIDLVMGFRGLEQAISELCKNYSESSNLRKIWSIVRQERYTICREAEGQVLSWGTGENGELGLGVIGNLSVFPQPIRKFRNLCIIHIAAGSRHVLAIDSRGRLFSWGCGGGGRLGHGDFEDRMLPELVAFFASLQVVSCSAGDAHSAVLTTVRASEGGEQQRRICTFGRGAHGRLGNGSNRNLHTPQLVLKFPPSLVDAQVHMVACGGAHTLALVSISAPQGLANPRGRLTSVLAWGYGNNGQLGTGHTTDSFIPVKSRVPKWDIIVEVSAGRSWSLAKSAGGDLYSWGKGLRGQLGQGPVVKFCLAPKKIETFASFVHISSGYAHNIAIAVSRKQLNTALTEEEAKALGASYDPFSPYYVSSLKRRKCSSLFTFDCCRRVVANGVASWRRKIRFQCIDCAQPCICLSCAKLCHVNHRLCQISNTVLNAVVDGTVQIGKDRSITQAQGVVIEPPVESSAHNFELSHRAALILLTQKHALRPPRVGLETMPRISILDLARCLVTPVPPPPPVSLAFKRRGQKKEVKRRNWDTIKELETPRHLLEVNRDLHLPVGVSINARKSVTIAGSPTRSRGRQNRSPSKTRNSPAVSPSKGQRKSAQQNSNRIRKSDAQPLAAPSVALSTTTLPIPPCCRCGLFGGPSCKMLPMIQEELTEGKEAKEEDIIEKELRRLSIAARVAPVSKPSTITRSKVVPPKKVAKSDEQEKGGRRSHTSPTSPEPAPVAVSAAPAKDLYPVTRPPGQRKRKGPKLVIQRDAEFMRDYQLGLRAGVRILAAKRIQRAARSFMQRDRDKKAAIDYILLRREMCSMHYQKNILNVVMAKVSKEYGHYRETQELLQMRSEEEMTRKYAYYVKLQQALIGISAFQFGLRRFVGELTPSLPLVTVDGEVLNNVWYPTFALTYASVRHQQLHTVALPQRVDSRMLAMICRFLPRSMVHRTNQLEEGWTPDSDTMAFVHRYMRDKGAERWRREVERKRVEKELQRQRVAQMALERLRAKQNATKLMMQQAEAITMRNNQQAANLPAPPMGPPPRFMVVRAALEAHEVKREVLRQEQKKWRKEEDAAFNIKGGNPRVLYRQRRFTITDPCSMYRRVVNLRENLTESNRLKRSDSLPGNLAQLMEESQPVPVERIQSLSLSLEMYTQRLTKLSKAFDLIIRDRAEAVLREEKIYSNNALIRMCGKLFQTAVLSPRLPIEMNSIITNGYRRRTIGEPERLARQLSVMQDVREKFCSVVESSQEKLLLSRRRRSYDNGELLDHAHGIEEAMGYSYVDDKAAAATLTSLTKDSVHMEQLMVRAKMLESTDRTASLLEGQDLGLSNKFGNRFGSPIHSNQEQDKARAGGKRDKAKTGLVSSVRGGGLSTKNAAGFDRPGMKLDAVIWENPAREGNQQYSHPAITNDSNWGDPSASSENPYSMTKWRDASEAEVWQEHYTETGQTYYYKVATGESSWDYPSDPNAQIETQNQNDEGNWYWFNSYTGESRWI